MKNIRDIFSSKSLPILALVSVLSFHPESASGNSEKFTIEEAQQARDVARRSAHAVRFASPYHRYMAWRDDGGVLIVRQPDFSPERLLSRDEVGVVTMFSRSPDGSTIFYVRERSDSSGVRDIFSMDVSQGSRSSKLVASGNDVPNSDYLVISQDCRSFIFFENNNMFEFRVTGDGAWVRRELTGARDSGGMGQIDEESVVYSPDGTKVAFVSTRKAGQSYIAIHDIRSETTTYVQPGVFQDNGPVWSPDGSELAFVRKYSNAAIDHRFSSQRGKGGGVPWRIVVTSIKTGEVRTVWKADFGAGSISEDARVIWAPSGDIIFPWEKTGWRLLYAVSSEGGGARLLTPGRGEISDFGLSADGYTIVYSANFGDLMRDHLYTLSLRDGNQVQMTFGSGNERAPREGSIWLNQDGFVSYVSEDSDNFPARILVRGPDGSTRQVQVLGGEIVNRDRAIWDNFLPAETFSVESEDGLVSQHVIIKPKTAPPENGYPVIVNAHGGPTEQAKPSGGYAYAFGQYVASRGYMFIDINYRGSRGFGLDYRLPDGRGATGGSELKDLAALVGHLKSRKDVDSKRLGIVGASYGGFIVGLAMSRLPNDFTAGVSQFGVANWVIEMKKDKEARVGSIVDPLHYLRLSERARIEDLAHDSSPNSRMDDWRGPTLLTIGELDTNGHIEAVQDLGYNLLRRGVPVEFYVDTAGGHDVFVWDKVFDFFERTLKPVH